MALLAFLMLSSSICLLPVYALHRRRFARARDYFVASEHTPPAVVQNASIAYALPMASFSAVFSWGATGDFLPAIISSCSFGMGVCLLYLLRRPVLTFLEHALRNDRSITVHQFIARRHGNDQRVRLFASALTVLALIGLIMAEAFAASTLVASTTVGRADTFIIMVGLLALSGLYTLPSGQSGVIRSAQAQLGIMYFALFGSTVLLLYLLMSGVRTMPPHGTFAVACVAVCCALILSYRRSKYVDTSPVEGANPAADVAVFGRAALASQLFRRFLKILNPCISVTIAAAMGLALVELYSEGIPAVLRDSVAALGAGTRVPAMELIALLLLPLFYPIVDITNWQRMAALDQNARGKLGSGEWSAALGRVFGIYAVETTLIRLFMCMFGAIAALSAATPASANIIHEFVEQLGAEENFIAGAALALLTGAVLAITVPTISSAFSASLCAIRYDILPIFLDKPILGKMGPVGETRIRKFASIAGGGLCLVVLGTFYVVDRYRPMAIYANEFPALVFALYCAQLSFVPLVLGPVIGRARAELSPGWALSVIGCSALVALGSVAVYVASRNELWLWGAVPASLGCSLLVFIVASIRPKTMHNSTNRTR